MHQFVHAFWCQLLNFWPNAVQASAVVQHLIKLPSIRLSDYRILGSLNWMLQTAYFDSAIVEFRKRKCKSSDIISGVDWTSPQTESLPFTNHKCNTFILMSPPKKRLGIWQRTTDRRRQPSQTDAFVHLCLSVRLSSVLRSNFGSSVFRSPEWNTITTNYKPCTPHNCWGQNIWRQSQSSWFCVGNGLKQFAGWLVQIWQQIFCRRLWSGLDCRSTCRRCRCSWHGSPQL